MSYSHPKRYTLRISRKDSAMIRALGHLIRKKKHKYNVLDTNKTKHTPQRIVVTKPPNDDNDTFLFI